MTTTVRLAIRDWDWVTPLVLGEVPLTPLADAGVELLISRVPALESLWSDAPYELAETSLSQYVRHRASGNDDVLAAPYFLMQAFRHRCIITLKSSQARSLADLKGTTIGLSGWGDSGNVWTLAALQDAGVGIDDADWIVGRLTANHDHHDRLQGYGEAGHIMATQGDETLLGLLDEGRISAILTPFMPPGFYAPDSPWRFVVDDVRAAEFDYAATKGFVPGFHLLGYRTSVPKPIVEAVTEVLESSYALWRTKREKYADTSMWLTCDLLAESQHLPANWRSGRLADQEAMLQEFLDLQVAQRLVPAADQLDIDTLFTDWK